MLLETCAIFNYFSYSETGCSFARHFAILSRNVGILIGSLLRANWNLREQVATFIFEVPRASCQAPVASVFISP